MRKELSCHCSPRQPTENSAEDQRSIGDASDRELAGKYKACDSAGQPGQDADEDDVCSPPRTIICSATLLLGSFADNARIVSRKHSPVVAWILPVVAIINTVVSPPSSLHQKVALLSAVHRIDRRKIDDIFTVNSSPVEGE
ncbi:hypothetical protein [Rhizobium sp. WYJ-E13]|uniref:hypothetical protein n=1 Tax=Rhizobium sp. WYJ-E13 TaxID=2849093 RepID=UPI001C1EDB05|nr:hypothetical protein [Rhizobium sp. WYJ-E13]QWW71446.1 hypothetical protein KQ933_22625 [Rhizobium sp. WYJ-E13]